MVLQEMQRLEEPVIPEEDDARDEESFFPQRKKITESDEEELGRFLSDPSNEKESLHYYPLLKEVFRQLSTAFSSSVS